MDEIEVSDRAEAIANSWSTNQADKPDVDITDIGVAPASRSDAVTGAATGNGGDNNDFPITSVSLPTRPQFRRDQAHPPPPQQPPPPPAPPQQQQPGNPTDSLSLMQLKRIVTDMPRLESTAYAFTYKDASSFPEELEEWFSYSQEEQNGIAMAKLTFEEQWDVYCRSENLDSQAAVQWTGISEDRRRAFIGREVQRLDAPDIYARAASLGTLLYIASGAWGETAGRLYEEEGSSGNGEDPENRFERSGLQLNWIEKGAKGIYDAMGVQAVFDVMRGACAREMEERSNPISSTPDEVEKRSLETRELNYSLTLMYLLVEAGRQSLEAESSSGIRDEIATLQPSILLFLLEILAKLRWNEVNSLPLTKLVLLFWKSLLLVFGNTHELNRTKAAVRKSLEPVPSGNGQTLITASPLDYHVFRQEITSKYPAYNPPPPLIPLELENNSILPPLPNHPSRVTTSIGPNAGVGSGNANGNSGSILYQPVHIATPAPSPPPSPAGPGGKGGKKQNYQTNQNFPFLYPPLDASSNSAGGKGNAGLQESLVGRKWEGSDIPKSILEAGDLFSQRMRMSRAVRQLWEERERFMRFERGWESFAEPEEKINDEIYHHTAVETRGDSGEEENKSSEKSSFRKAGQDFAGKIDNRHESARRISENELTESLMAVEDFYRSGLPYLQSLVIVLLKEVLSNVTYLVTQPNSLGHNGLGPGFQENGISNDQTKSRMKDSSHKSDGVGGNASNAQEDGDEDLIELDAFRAREIRAKAISAILVLLLKWFKISHVLKYEYLTQLLIDSNYLPLVLKLFAHQEIDRVVDSKCDRAHLSFFNFCQMHSSDPLPSTKRLEAESSEDEALPPPIKLRRNNTQQRLSHNRSNPPNVPPRRPEVDELGYPTTDLPTSPITTFSWRNFFTSINWLRIMQKIVRRKTHRNLLLVQYKSSTILRKFLKVPQSDIRLYTLKLFKGQVPYCGRKWRQSNMRVITAVYLHVSPELRDDWLAGGDVDAEVEEALPLEQALRSLTHWWHCVEYPEQMGVGDGVLESELDFFARELDKMDWGIDDNGDELGREEWEGPVQMEAW